MRRDQDHETLRRWSCATLIWIAACNGATTPAAAQSDATPAKSRTENVEPPTEPSPSTPTPRPAPEPPVPLRIRTTVSASDLHTCAIVRARDDATDRVKCWGQNESGELGLGDRKARVAADEAMGDVLPFVALPGVTELAAIEAGPRRTCALEANGRLWCWGEGWDGPAEGVPPPPAVVALPGPVASFGLGQSHACAVVDAGDLYCWGNQGAAGGAVGSGGTEPVEPGADMAPVKLGTRAHVQRVSAGSSHTCALLDGGAVKCFGLGRYGALGLEHTDDVGTTENTMGDHLPAVALPHGVVPGVLAMGGLHSCVLTTQHEVWCWGANRAAQLGIGHTNAPGDKPGQSRTPSPASRVDLGAGRVVALDAGNAHTCAILEGGSTARGLKCWGTGGLGVHPSGPRGDAPGEMGDALPYVDLGAGLVPVAVAAGSHTCAIVVEDEAWRTNPRPSTGRLKCWGHDPNGATGIEQDEWDFERPDKMGDALPFVDLGTGVGVVLP